MFLHTPEHVFPNIVTERTTVVQPEQTWKCAGVQLQEYRVPPLTIDVSERGVDIRNGDSNPQHVTIVLQPDITTRTIVIPPHTHVFTPHVDQGAIFINQGNKNFGIPLAYTVR